MKVFVSRLLPLELLRPIVETGGTVDVYEKDSRCPREELLRRSRDADGLLVQTSDVVDEELLDNAQRLRVVACCSIGYDNVDVAAARSRGIVVCNAPAPDLIETTAEAAVALLASVAKRVTRLHVGQQKGELPPYSILHPMGQPMRRRMSGIVGFGRIGGAIARIMRNGFDNEIVYFSRSRKTELEASLGARPRELNDLLAESDFVFIVVPLTDETRCLLNERNLPLLRHNAIVVNVARSGVIDDDVLIRLLADDRFFGAGLDVYNAEAKQCRHPNLVLTAHMANGEDQAMKATVELAIGNIAAVLRDETAISPVGD